MVQARAAQISRTGGPGVIEFVDVDLPEPAPGEARVRHTAIGLNYIDAYHRSGLYPVALPSRLGMEATGVVEAVGEGVSLNIGDRVATFGPQLGAYATARNVSAASLFVLPDTISNEVAAAALLKTCTVEAIVERAASVQADDWCLVHAAAGGIGLILVQWLKHVGARVIGTVSTPDKARLAIEAGADHVIRYKNEDVATRVRELTDGKGVAVCFDGIGASTWQASLDATARRGMIVSFGNAGGAVSGVNIGVLAQKGSLFVTRPTLFDYYATPEDRAAGIARVWDMIVSGAVKVSVGQTYALEDVAQAHRDLEAGRTVGSTILTV